MDKEKWNEYMREWYKKNKEKHKMYCRRWFEKNKERYKEWQKKYMKEYNEKKKMQKPKYEFICKICGKKFSSRRKKRVTCGEKECMRLYNIVLNKEWMKKPENKEKHRKIAYNYYIKNKTNLEKRRKWNESRKKSYLKKKEYYSNYYKNYYKKNKDKILETLKEWRIKNPDYYKNYRKKVNLQKYEQEVK